MDVSIMHSTTEYRGDHSAEVRIALTVRPGETVEQLARRILIVPNPDRSEASYADCIEIRLVKP